MAHPRYLRFGKISPRHLLAHISGSQCSNPVDLLIVLSSRSHTSKKTGTAKSQNCQTVVDSPSNVKTVLRRGRSNTLVVLQEQ